MKNGKRQRPLRKLTPETYDYVFHNYQEEGIRIFSVVKMKMTWQRSAGNLSRAVHVPKVFSCFPVNPKADNAIIGWCGYHTWYFLHFRAEIGYVLSDESKRVLGFMKKALFAVIKYGFEQMGMK